MSTRWLWLTTVADVDGPGRALSALLTRWPADDPMIVCALRRASRAFRDAIPPTVDVIEFDVRTSLDVRAIPRLIRTCRDWQPAVLHTQLSRADWMGRVVGRRLGIPVVSTIQNVHSRMYRAEFAWPFARLGMLLDRLTLPLADSVVAVSEGVRADVLGAYGHPDVRVVPNGLDLGRTDRLKARTEIRRRWGIPPDAPVAGTIARLVPQKGAEYLIQAARQVCAALPTARFVHMGDGVLAADAVRRVHDLGLDGRFLLRGHVEDPMSWLPGLDLFVLPSLWEGLPIALLEAIAAGLPVVATRVSGIEEIVDERNGVLVAPADANALASAILELLTDPDRRRALGASARERAQEWDAARSARAYRDLFLQLVEQRSSHTPRRRRSGV